MTTKMNICMAGVALMLCVVANGCANNRDLIAKASIATKSDGFTEAASSDAQVGKAIIDFAFCG